MPPHQQGYDSVCAWQSTSPSKCIAQLKNRNIDVIVSRHPSDSVALTQCDKAYSSAILTRQQITVHISKQNSNNHTKNITNQTKDSTQYTHSALYSALFLLSAFLLPSLFFAEGFLCPSLLSAHFKRL
jgi:hypothetical protein